MDHRHPSRYYCRAHIQFTSSLTLPLRSQVDFFHYMIQRESCQRVQFYVNKTGCSPSLSDITNAHYAVWTTVGTDRQKHKSAPMAWRTKLNLVRATMQRRSVQCVLWESSPVKFWNVPGLYYIHPSIYMSSLGVDRLSAPILSILPIIDIGHFQNIFADIIFYNFFFFFFFYNANKHTIYRWHLLVNK